MGDKNRGLYGKFRVERTDGRSAPGEKHYGCRYFVLDLDHDEHAPAALIEYALSCQDEFPNLASDLLRMMHEPTESARERYKAKIDALEVE
jgi:hypothetical protein